MVVVKLFLYGIGHRMDCCLSMGLNVLYDGESRKIKEEVEKTQKTLLMV